MKYAVIRAGGKQYVAREGETIEVDRMPVEVGSAATFDEVLFVEDGKKMLVGTPLVKGAKVVGTVTGQIKAPKVLVFKYIPKERYRRRRGHRQQYTQISIEKISLGAEKKAAAAEAEAPAAD